MLSTFKLEEHSQQEFVKVGNRLGRAEVAARMGSEFGLMHPLGCGENQGQVQGQASIVQERVLCCLKGAEDNGRDA